MHATHSNVLPKDGCFSFWTVTCLEVVDKVAWEHSVELQEEVVHRSFQVQEEEPRDEGCMGGKEKAFTHSKPWMLNSQMVPQFTVDIQEFAYI